MKQVIVFLALTGAFAQAFAGTMNCQIKEGGEQTRETSVQHNYDPMASHSFTTFESAYATGFVAENRGYGVINVVSKATGLANSFYGKLGNGNVVGGNLTPTKDFKNWFQVECK